MRGTALAPNATARIEVARPDRGGNVPMLVHVRGLPRLPARGYYTLYVLRNGKPVVPCGTFNISGRATVAFTVPYRLTPSEEMVVARERAGGKHPGPIVMTTTDV
jgi:hypothetical protein